MAGIRLAGSALHPLDYRGGDIMDSRPFGNPEFIAVGTLDSRSRGIWHDYSGHWWC